jgi:hypothetical protein
MIQQIALGQNPDLRTMTGQNNPLTDTLYKQTTSDMSLANRATDPMLQGYATTTTYLTALNTALEGLPDKFFQVKGALDALSKSQTGSALNSVVAGAAGAIGTLAVAKGVRSMMSKVAGKGAQAAETAAAQGAGKVATRVGLSALGKAVPVIGGVVSASSGQGLMSSMLTSALVAGGIAGVTTGGAAAIPAGLAAAGLTALGWLGTKAFNAMTSTSSAALAAGGKASGVGTGNLSLPADADPKLVQTLTSAGFSGQSLVTAYGIAKAESGGRANAFNPTGLDKSYGLFQINMENNDPRNPNMGIKRNAAYLKKYGDMGYKGPQSLYDPKINAKIAYDMSKGGTNFKPWTTYTSGKYENQLNVGPSTGTGSTVNINLKIDKASDAEAIAFAKKVKDILMKDKSISAMGSK